MSDRDDVVLQARRQVADHVFAELSEPLQAWGMAISIRKSGVHMSDAAVLQQVAEAKGMWMQAAGLVLAGSPLGSNTFKEHFVRAASGKLRSGASCSVSTSCLCGYMMPCLAAPAQRLVCAHNRIPAACAAA